MSRPKGAPPRGQNGRDLQNATSKKRAPGAGPVELTDKADKGAGKADRKRRRDDTSAPDVGNNAQGPSLPKKAKPNAALGLPAVPRDSDTKAGRADAGADAGAPVTAPLPGSAQTLSGVAAELDVNYDLTVMNIASVASIEQKVSRILGTLASFSFAAPAKPNIVLLHAQAKVASKMISIVEIAKREIAAAGGKWYQYNEVKELTVKQESKNGKEDKATLDPDDGMDVDEDNGDGAASAPSFETMMTPFERAVHGKPKIRAVPVMSIYLSRVRVDSLRKLYG